MALSGFFVRLVSGAVTPVLIGAYLIAYILLQYSGLFSTRPENIMRVLYQWPALAGAAALFLFGMAGFLCSGCKADKDISSRRVVFYPRFVYLGLLLIGSGIVVSSLTRFEGSVVLNEGQAVVLQNEGYYAGAMYQGRFARQPQGGIFMNSIAPFISVGGTSVIGHKADILFQKEQISVPEEIRLRSYLPSFAGGFIYCIGNVGYSPHFTIFDSKGEIIEDTYAVMQLFPAGAEDFFRFDTIPHTFYLRYYPDRVQVQDNAMDSNRKPGALYKVRVSRNIELIADAYIAPGEPIGVDSLVLSLGDVKRWVEVRIIRDPGLYILVPGIVLVGLGLVRYVLGRYGLIR